VWNSAPVTRTAWSGALELRHAGEASPEAIRQAGALHPVDGVEGRGQTLGGKPCLSRQLGRVLRRQDGARRFRLTEILELARNPGDALVEHGPGDAARLRQNDGCLFGIAARFVGEAPSLGIHLNATFGDRRPGDQNPVRVGDRSVALVAGEMARRRAERLAPAESVPLIAGMAEIERTCHLRNVARHQHRVAAVAAAGTDQGAAREMLLAPIRTPHENAGDVAVAVDQERHRLRVAHERGAGADRRLAQAVHQLRARPAREAVHAKHGVARIAEIVDQPDGQTMRVGEPLEGRSRGARDRLDESGVGRALRLRHDVGGERRRTVLDARRSLPARARGRDQPGRERRRVARLRVAFEHERIEAGGAGSKRRCQSGGAGSDDHDRRFGRESDSLGRKDAHACRISPIASATVARRHTGRSAAIAVSCTG
jgi:hypothetical protein